MSAAEQPIAQDLGVVYDILRRWRRETPFPSISVSMRLADGDAIFTITEADGKIVADVDGDIIEVGR
jgi:hypothetical protein